VPAVQPDAALAELREHLAEIEDLDRAQSVLHWDLEVWMPPGGGEARSKQLATLAKLGHDRSVSDRIGELLDAAEPYLASLPYEHVDACLARVARRRWDKARRVPSELAAEFTEAQARSYQAWVAARENDDFESFRPWLERMLELRMRYVECFAPYDDPYDVLLDDFEEGMKTDEVRTIFARLQPELTALVAEHATEDGARILTGTFPTDAQERLSRDVIERFGVDWDEFRLDLTVHPFQVTFGAGDIRMTTRYAEDDVNSLFTAMHEAGHGLYEHGIDRRLDRTPLQHGVSSALHESQSRLWENVVGRSLPFWRWLYPRLQETFRDHFGTVALEDFHRAVNLARRTHIRVDADETSYGLHIILRFELEQELFSGRLAARDVPEAWNTRFEELLGLAVPNDQLGALQDSHWASGGFGYFPTYLLGSVLSVQIWERAKQAIPDVEEQIERGEFAALHGWLRENLYALGSMFTPAETIERVAGGPIDPEPYLGYLRDKLGTLAAA
jgi:carboxypeptidase Taq